MTIDYYLLYESISISLPETDLVKRRHGLICTPNLDHIKVCSLTAAIMHGALHLSMVDVVPGAFPTHDVVNLFPLHRLPLIVSPSQGELVRARPALETIQTAGRGAGDLTG